MHVSAPRYDSMGVVSHVYMFVSLTGEGANTDEMIKILVLSFQKGGLGRNVVIVPCE